MGRPFNDLTYVLGSRCRNHVGNALQAIPPSKVPAYLAGNLGEVILLASLVAAEVGLRSSGL